MFDNVFSQVDKLAASFLALGLQKGDRVGMWGPNTREWVITQFATGKAGLIMVGYFMLIKTVTNVIDINYEQIGKPFERYSTAVPYCVYICFTLNES